MNNWFFEKKSKLLELAQKQTPLYVYNSETILQKARELKESLTCIDFFYFAIKANDFPEILHLINKHFPEIGFECVSIYEVKHIINQFPNKPKNEIFFSPNFCEREEFEEALKLGVRVNVDCVFPLREWTDTFKNHKISLRLDSGHAHGHHEFVKTASYRSKFGISGADLPEIVQLCSKNNIQIVGLHSHVGSGILENQVWAQNAAALLEAAFHFFPQIEWINLGGGLGIVEKADRDFPLDLKKVNEFLQHLKKESKNIKFHMEPGRFFVAESGVLLTKVTQIKQKEHEKWYVGCNSGFNSLIRPALYSSYHHIVNLSRYDSTDPMFAADIVGNICESGDILGRDRSMPKSTTSGDILLIGTAGAYGRVMAMMNYNQRSPANEILLD